MFKINDIVTYGTNGVCKITGTEEKDLMGTKKTYLVLKPTKTGDNSTYFVPSDNENLLGKMRKLLSEDGLVIVVIGISDATGELVNEPYLITRGFVYTDEAGKLGEEAKQVLHDTLQTINLRENHDWNEARNLIRKPLRNFFYKKTMRTPMILPIIFRI